MANSLVRNPILLDTFSADVTISARDIRVKKIVLKSAADGDICVLEDISGNQVVWLTQTGNADTVEVDFGDCGFIFPGLVMDVSDCTGLGANDLLWIYLV